MITVSLIVGGWSEVELVDLDESRQLFGLQPFKICFFVLGWKSSHVMQGVSYAIIVSTEEAMLLFSSKTTEPEIRNC